MCCGMGRAVWRGWLPWLQLQEEPALEQEAEVRFPNPCHLFNLAEGSCWFTFPPWDFTSRKEWINYAHMLRSAEF